MSARKLLDDCFLNDKQRMRHDEVLQLLADRLSQVVGIEPVALFDAAGRICAEDIHSARAIPQGDNAAVDGYAFAHSDYVILAGRFNASGTTSAGTPPSPLAPKTAREIYTGALMPEGADTVAMQEDCRLVGQMVHIPAGLQRGANCRLKGEDVQPGTRIISAGHVITPAHIAALASIGLEQVNVRAKLRVGVLSTGNEIVQPGSATATHQVYDANRPMLRSLLAVPSVEAIDLGHLPDDLEKLKTVLKTASEKLDMIVATGGASRGGEDHMLDALDHLGKRHLWQIAIKPGRPMMLGQIDNCILLGLPGNPVAAHVCSLLYVRPAMARLMGVDQRPPRPFMLPAAFQITKKKKDRREFARGWRDNKGFAQKFSRDGSGLISGLVASGGLIELPEDISSVAKGDLVRFIPLSEFDIAHKDQP
ncbi:MAG: gephyrin-like molybdotransferase Glp [Pseudomonadota bacterium]